jgi:hypothetical protein
LRQEDDLGKEKNVQKKFKFIGLKLGKKLRSMTNSANKLSSSSGSSTNNENKRSSQVLLFKNKPLEFLKRKSMPLKETKYNEKKLRLM